MVERASDAPRATLDAVLPKRRLPVLQASADEPTRPPWQWVCFGALSIFAVWVPLSAVVGAVAARTLAHANDPATVGRAALLVSGAYVAELGTGALAGGYLVGKWGPPGVGTREAGLAGLAASVALAVVAWASSGATMGLVLVVLIAPLAAGLGGALGLRRRTKNWW